ncbi:MAG: MFS transporter [Myxococcota bacterium]
MQAALMRERRFWPLFWTQFLGAFNDNLFKNGLGMMIAFRAVTVGGLDAKSLVALTAAIFIAPYFLFSVVSGQLSDKYDKAWLMRLVKVSEVVVMAVGAVGFWLGNVPMLLAVLFLIGVHSTVFGPAKYAILPQQLNEAELVAGNALVEMGTNLAILLGTIAGGVLMAWPGGEHWVAAGTLVVAAAGLATSFALLPAPSMNPAATVSLDPVGPLVETIRLCRRGRSVWLSILGISWFWAFGAALLSVFPTYTEQVLGGGESLATLFLGLFSVGIGIGSLLCEKLSRERLELGLVPIGTFGMSLFTFDLFLVGHPWALPDHALTVGEFLSTFSGIRIAVDLLLLAVAGGFMIVPLYTLVQWRTPKTETSRVIAGNNVLNAVYIVGSALLLMGLFAVGLDEVHVFLVLAVLNAAAALYTYTVVPEFALRFCVWVLSHVVYRIKVVGHANIPIDGPVVLVANHVSFVDWLVLAAALKRPPRFVMHASFYDLPVLRWLFDQARVIPIAGSKEDPERLETAMETIHRELQDEQVVCIFPEGRITDTGQMYPFKAGVERIVARDPVPVVPIAINGLWGSFFSRRDGAALTKPFRRFYSRVWVTVGAPIPPGEATAERLGGEVERMWSAHPQA